jgi:hypothetical protein
MELQDRMWLGPLGLWRQHGRLRHGHRVHHVPRRHIDFALVPERLSGGRTGVAALVPLSVVLVLPACHHDPEVTPTGTALEQGFTTYTTIAPIGLSKRVGVLVTPLVNSSTETLTVDHVDVAGPGIGSVVKIDELSAVPDRSGLQSFPGGIWTTNPPVDREGGMCHRPVIEPLQGLVLSPGGRARLWIVIQAVQPGAYKQTTQTVYYTQADSEFRQEIDFYFRGTVRPSSAGPVMDPGETSCLSHTNPLNP